MRHGGAAHVAPSRGEVWMVDLDPMRQREPSGLRPALVLSVDKFHHGAAATAA